MKKIIGIIVMALLAFSLFAGGTKEAAAETSVARDNLVIAVSTEPMTLHPATTNVVYDELVLKMLYGTQRGIAPLRESAARRMTFSKPDDNGTHFYLCGG